jgi:16S rRNA G966 N2-methylase RsmD
MKTKFFGLKIAGGISAALFMAVLIGQTAMATPAQEQEIANLKQQLAQCHLHKMHRRHHVATAPKQVVLEKPVVIEKVVEKQVFVDRPVASTMIDKSMETQVTVETPITTEKLVVVEHSAHRKHLLHFGVPFISLYLF